MDVVVGGEERAEPHLFGVDASEIIVFGEVNALVLQLLAHAHFKLLFGREDEALRQRKGNTHQRHGEEKR